MHDTEHETILALRKLKRLNPDAHCTYFPIEGTYQVHVWGKSISTMYSVQLAAIYDAIDRLENGKPWNHFI